MSKQGKGTLGKKAGMVVSLLAIFAAAPFGAVGCRANDPVPPDPIVKDTEAPRLRTNPKDVTTQVGLYTGLGSDLAAVDAVDNETARVEVYPKSISFGAQTRLLGKEDKSVYLAEAGEYTLTFVMRDEAGNEAEGSYKIIAQAVSSRPMIDVPALFAVWKEEDGKVRVPQANIVHDLPVTLSVTVKDGESIVPVENGAFVAEKSQYTLCYTATDSRGVTAESETRLLINERGVINSFDTAGEESLWGTDARLQDGKLYLENSASESVFSYGEFFECSDWQGSKSLKLTLQNNRTADAVVRVQVMSGGAWRELSSFLLRGATANDALERVLPSEAECLARLGGVERAEGIRLVVACSGGVNIAVDEIALSDMSEELPDGTASGFAAGNYTVEGNGSVYAAVQADAPAADRNAVRMNVYSTAHAEVQIGLVYEQETVYARAVLEAGENNLLRVPGLESSAVSGALKGIVINNLESYPVSVQLSGTGYAQVTSVEDCRVGGMFAVEYGDTFTVPNPFTADDRYYGDLQVELLKDGERIRALTVGDGLQNIKDKADALEAGAEYLLRYTYTDGVSGETCTAEYPLFTLKHSLSFTVAIPVLYLNDEAQTAVNIESDVYTSEQLASAEIARFYREKGKSTWIPFTQFSAEKNKIYQFRYSVSFDGHYKETVFERFVHANAHTIDFEYEPAAVKGNAVFYSDVSGSYMDERFLFDGGYYNLKSTGNLTDVCVSNDWSMSGSSSYKIHQNFYGWGGFHVTPEMTKEPVNAVRFWANAVVGQETQLSLQWSRGWVYTPAFELKAGVHQYTLYLERSDVVSVSSFTMLMIGGSTVYLDDVEFLYIDSLSLETPEYSNVFAISDPIELAKPAVRSDLFTAAELDGASWTCRYSVDGGEQKTLAPNEEGKYYLALGKGGKVRVEWTVSLGEYTAAASAEFTAGIVPFTVPVTGGRLGEEIVIAAPQFDEEVIDINKIQVAVSYRFGDGEWTQTTVGASLVLGKTGTVEIKYEIAYAYTETLTLYGEETYQIIVPEKDVIWSFEDSDPWFGARPYDFGKPNVHSVIEEKEDGSHWLALHSYPEMDSWLGIGSAGSVTNGDGVVLEGEASTLIFTLTTDRDYSALQFWFVTDGSPKGEYHTAVIRKGENQIQFTMDRPFSVIHTFAVEIKHGVPVVYIDDIRTGFSFEVAPPAEPAPVGQKYTVALPDLTHLDGAVLTVYQRFGEEEWAEITPESGVYAFTPDTEGVYQIRYLVTVGEIAIERKVTLTVASSLYLQPVTLGATRQGDTIELPLPTAVTQGGAAVTWKVEYSLDGETYTEIPASEGKYLFTPAEAGRYTIRYTASVVINGVFTQKSVTAVTVAKDRNVVADFEDGDTSYIDLKMTSGGIIEEDGSMWLRAASGAGDWVYLNDLDFSIGAPIDTLILRLQSTGAVTAGGSGIIYVYTDQGNFFAESVRNEGDIYTFTFARAFNKLTCFSVGVDAGVTIKIDYILAAAAEENPFVVTDPVLADGVLGEEYTVTLPGVPEGAADVSYAVQYRVKGAADWTEIIPADGEYRFTPGTTGTYEISFVVTGTMEGKEYEYNKTFEIGVTASFAFGTVTLPAAKEGDRYEIALPSLVVPNGVAVTWKVEYSFDGETYTEIPASEGKYFFTPQEAGNYAVRYTVTPAAESGLQAIEQTVILQVRDRFLLEDFENGLPAGANFYAGGVEPTFKLLEDGNTVLRAQMSGAPGWTGFTNASYNAGTAVTQLQITLIQYAETTREDGKTLTAGDFSFQFDGSAAWVYPSAVIKGKDNRYTLVFNREFTEVNTFIVQISREMGVVYLDDLRAYINPFTVTDPVLADGVLGKEYTVTLPAVPEGATDVSYEVQYRVKGAAVWTEIIPADGEYRFTPNSAAAYEIGFTVSGTVAGEQYTYEKTFEITVIDPFVVTDPVLANGILGEEYTVALPAVPGEATDVNYTVQYRLKDAEVWETVTPEAGAFRFTPSATGVYEVRFVVTGKIDGVQYSYETAGEFTVAATILVESVTLPATTDGTEYTVALPEVTVPSGVTVSWKVEYVLSGGSAVEITPEDGDYKFTPEVPGNYEIRYIITPDSESGLSVVTTHAILVVKDRLMVEDFEDGLSEGISYYATDFAIDLTRLEDGNTVLYARYSGGGTGWAGLTNTNFYDLGETVTQLRITVIQHANGGEGEDVELIAGNGGSFWFITDTSNSLYPVKAEKEGNVYTLTFDKAFSKIKTFTVGITKAMGAVHIDNLRIVPPEPGDPYLLNDFENDLPVVESIQGTHSILTRDGNNWWKLNLTGWSYFVFGFEGADGETYTQISMRITDEDGNPMSVATSKIWLYTTLGSGDKIASGSGSAATSIEQVDDTDEFIITFKAFTQITGLCFDGGTGVLVIDDVRVVQPN